MKTYAYLLLVVTMYVQCSSPTEQIITPDNVVEVSEEMSMEDGLSMQQDSVLNVLATLHQGRSQFLNLLNSSGFTEVDLGKFLVGETDFNKSIDDLFIYYQENQVTYADLLAEIESRQVLLDQYQRKVDSIDALIEAECLLLHDRAAARADSLAKLARFSVTNISPYREDYTDYMAVTVKAENLSGKPIEAVNFTVKLFDKLGDQIVDLRLSSSNKLTGNRTLYYYYKEYDYDRREIYKALEETSMTHIGDQTFEITKVNLDGQVIENDINYSLGLFEETNRTPGYCVYMDSEHPLKLSKDSLGDPPGFDDYPHILRMSQTASSLVDMGAALRESMKEAFKD